MPHVVRRRLFTGVAAFAAAALVAASIWLVTGRAEAGTLSGGLYRDPIGGTGEEFNLIDKDVGPCRVDAETDTGVILERILVHPLDRRE